MQTKKTVDSRQQRRKLPVASKGVSSKHEKQIRDAAAPRQKPDGRPLRPLNPYTLFFLSKRDRIIEGTDHLSLPFTKEEVERVSYWNQIKPKRAHRKTHGKINFQNLTKVASKRWKEMSLSDREVFIAQSMIERAKYDQKMIEWKKAGGSCSTKTDEESHSSSSDSSLSNSIRSQRSVVTLESANETRTRATEDVTGETTSTVSSSPMMMRAHREKRHEENYGASPMHSTKYHHAPICVSGQFSTNAENAQLGGALSSSLSATSTTTAMHKQKSNLPISGPPTSPPPHPRLWLESSYPLVALPTPTELCSYHVAVRTDMSTRETKHEADLQISMLHLSQVLPDPVAGFMNASLFDPLDPHEMDLLF